MKAWQFDLKSYLLGVFSSGVIIILIVRFRQALQAFWQSIRNSLENFLPLRSNVEIQYRKEIIRFSEREHLLSSLFPLSELLIPARLISLTPPWEKNGETAIEDITLETIPLIFDDPLFASYYQRKPFSLLEALAYGNTRLVMLGDLGSGKTTALLETAIRLSQANHSFDNLKSHLPLYLNAGELLQVQRKGSDLLKSLAEAAGEIFSTSVRRSLLRLIRRAIHEQRLVILLDGLDSLPDYEVDEIADILKKFLGEYPQTKIILATSTVYLSDLIPMGFSPLLLCLWNNLDSQTFLQKWASAWQNANLASQEDSTLWITWASQEKSLLYPLEWTLYLLLLFLKSPSPAKPSLLIESFFARCGLDNSSRDTIAEWAYQFIQNTLKNIPPPPTPNVLERLPTRELLITKSSSQSISFKNPWFLSIFASYALKDRPEETRNLLTSAKWSVAIQAAILAQAQSDFDSIAASPFNSLEEPFRVEKALAYTSSASETRNLLMKQIVNRILDEQEPSYLRQKLFSALLRLPTDDPLKLSKFLLQSKQPFLRHLGALGYGVTPHVTEINPLVNLLEDPHPHCFQAACLALVNIGTSAAIDAVISALIHGHDRLKAAAAQALANDPTLGYALLREAAKHEDPRVRKAVISGLLRIEAPWSKELLQTMSIEEELWVVKDAAVYAVSRIELPNPTIPQIRPETANLPFLIHFASQKGYGLSPGKSNIEVLLRALEEGDSETQQAVLDFFLFNPSEMAAPLIKELLHSPNQELRSQAYRTLWSFSVCRIGSG